MFNTTAKKFSNLYIFLKKKIYLIRVGTSTKFKIVRAASQYLNLMDNFLVLPFFLVLGLLLFLNYKVRGNVLLSSFIGLQNLRQKAMIPKHGGRGGHENGMKKLNLG